MSKIKKIVEEKLKQAQRKIKKKRYNYWNFWLVIMLKNGLPIQTMNTQ